MSLPAGNYLDKRVTARAPLTCRGCGLTRIFALTVKVGDMLAANATGREPSEAKALEIELGEWRTIHAPHVGLGA